MASDSLIKQVANEFGWSQADVRRAIETSQSEVTTRDEIILCIIRYAGSALLKRNRELGQQKRVNNQQKEMIGSLVEQLTKVQNFYAAQLVPTFKATIDAQAAYITELLRQGSGKTKEVQMGNDAEKLTKLHLQAFDLSDYTIKQIVKGLDSIPTKGGLKEYSAPDLVASVEGRLTNPQIRVENRAKLQRVLTWLKGESNVIPVDFLKGLSPEKKIEVLRERIQDLETQEQTLNEETSKLLTEATRMVASK